MKSRRLCWKLLATIAFVLLVAGVFVQLGGDRYGAGTEWLWAVVGGALAIYLVKPFGRFRRGEDLRLTDQTAGGGIHVESPRAATERSWRRLGGVRGKLLADGDRQSDLSEALYRLEYRPRISGDPSWLTPMDKAQAYDLQAPARKPKRKGKPKRQRYG